MTTTGEVPSAGVKGTLEALLDGGGSVRAALRAQVGFVRVVGRCACGCASVDLAVDRAAVAPAPVHGNPAADAWYVEPADAGVMVFTRDGYLSLLEIYSSAAAPVTDWPEPRFVAPLR